MSLPLSHVPPMSPPAPSLLPSPARLSPSLPPRPSPPAAPAGGAPPHPHPSHLLPAWCPDPFGDGFRWPRFNPPGYEDETLPQLLVWHLDGDDRRAPEGSGYNELGSQPTSPWENAHSTTATSTFRWCHPAQPRAGTPRPGLSFSQSLLRPKALQNPALPWLLWLYKEWEIPYTGK